MSRTKSVNSTLQLNNPSLISTALVLVLGFMFLTSLLYQPVTNPQSQLLNQLAWHTNNPALIKALNQTYLEHGLSESARVLTNPFVVSAPGASPATLVLSASSQSTASTQPLTDADLLEKRLYWEAVALHHPKYRDAWIQLYYLHLGKNQQEPYLQQIIELDPLAAAMLPKIEK